MTRSEGAFRLDIQGLRGLAVLLVVAYHAGLAPRAGFVGVDVFFVVSGFVIGGRLWEELGRVGSISVKNFVARRVRRLLPAMAVFTAVTSVIAVLLTNPYGDQQSILRTAGWATLMLGNFHLYRHAGYFDGVAERNPFLHTWSLSVEEQFFLVLAPFVALLWYVATRVRIDGRKLALVGIGIVSTVSAVIALMLTSGTAPAVIEAPGRFAFFAMPTRLWEFGAGVLASAVGSRGVRVGQQLRAVSGLFAIGVIATIAFFSDPAAPHPGLMALALVIATAVVLGTGGHGGVVDRALSFPALVWLGDVSYGWYLWHWPAIVFSGIVWPERPIVLVAAAAGALLPAWCSLRVLEQPVRSSAWWTNRRTAGLGLGCVLVPLALVAGLLLGTDAGWGVEETNEWYDYPPSRDSVCHIVNRDAPNAFELEQCTFGESGLGEAGTVGESGGRVLLLGDDLAASASSGVIQAASMLGLHTVLWSRAGCPFLIGASPAHYRRCGDWQAGAVRRLEAMRPDVVVVANQWPDYLRSRSSSTVLGDANGAPIADQVAAERTWTRAFERTLVRLDSLGIPVIVLAPVPDYGERFPRDRLSLLNPDPEVPELGLAEVRRVREPVFAFVQSAAARYEDVRLVDPVDALCGAACRPDGPDGWSYLGSRSLTNSGGALLAPQIGVAISELVDR